MPIHKKPGEKSPRTSITERSRALELFTNRLAERRLFTQYINEDNPRDQILFFHGDGGNGKSLLIDLLRQQYCHRVSRDDWQWLDAMEDDKAFVDAFANVEMEQPIPYAHVDFGARERGENRPREDWSGLIMLRRQLGHHKIKFPLFDFAIVLFLHKTRQLSKTQLKSLFPQQEGDLISSLLDIFLNSEGAYASIGWKVLGTLGKYFDVNKESLTVWLKKRGCDEEEVNRLLRLDPQAELRDELPHILGKDLNTAMQLQKAPPRVVLFFDTHESFWGNERLLHSVNTYFQRDEWLRRFLEEIYQPNHGVVVVVGGREAPRWNEANESEHPIPNEFLDTQLVGHLDRQDADEYLTRAEITDSELRAALIRYAEVEPNQAHPLHLGLSADVVLEASKQGQTLTAKDFAKVPATKEKSHQLVNRLLKYCPPNVRAAVEALASARSFDLEIYLMLGQALHFQATKPEFQQLVKFSFIRTETEDESDRFVIHDLLRRLLAQIATEETQEAHAELEKYYRQLAEAEPLAIVDTIYHVNQQNWKQGMEEWVNIFQASLDKVPIPPTRRRPNFQSS